MSKGLGPPFGVVSIKLPILFYKIFINVEQEDISMYICGVYIKSEGRDYTLTVLTYIVNQWFN